MMLFSIITVCFNSENTIERTIKSVLCQDVLDYEYLIIDGSSNDNTLEIVKCYEHLFDGRLKWISEPDNGLYDAMNKGIEMAVGDIIGIVNSDDWIQPDTLSILCSRIKDLNINSKGSFAISGSMVFHYRDGKEQVIRRTKDRFSAGIKDFQMYINHPATFISKSVYSKLGTYDSTLKISADNDLMIRMYMANIPFFFIDDILTNMSDGGISNKYTKQIFSDKFRIYDRYENNKIRYYYLILKYITKALLKLFISERILEIYRTYKSK